MHQVLYVFFAVALFCIQDLNAEENTPLALNLTCIELKANAVSVSFQKGYELLMQEEQFFKNTFDKAGNCHLDIQCYASLFNEIVENFKTDLPELQADGKDLQSKIQDLINSEETCKTDKESGPEVQSVNEDCVKEKIGEIGDAFANVVSAFHYIVDDITGAFGQFLHCFVSKDCYVNTWNNFVTNITAHWSRVITDAANLGQVIINFGHNIQACFSH